jgi:metallo-beta-lactamase family protein
LRIYGQTVRVQAEVKQLSTASAHVGSSEIIQWLGTAPNPPRCVFVTHGEPDAADALRRAIRQRLHWDARVPEYRDTVDLRSGQFLPG